MRRLVLGTRGSELARAQTSLVEEGLRTVHPEAEVAVEIISTRGDEKGHPSGRKGLFTAEIEHALLRRQIDVAIHSAKDLPSDETPGLEICAALPRGAVEDVLIMKGVTELGALPSGATVATGSVRRQHQLRWLRPDLDLEDLHGNVPTRLRKLIANPWEAIILARAGLERLGFDCSRGAIGFEGQELQTFLLPTDQFTPAGGQGIVALQIRSDDAETRGIIEELNHRETLLCLRAEREFLRLLQGDCGTPVGVLATMNGGLMTISAQFFTGESAAPRVATLQKKVQAETEMLGAKLLEMINGG